MHLEFDRFTVNVLEADGAMQIFTRNAAGKTTNELILKREDVQKLTALLVFAAQVTPPPVRRVQTQ